jgi:hypothetical protein
LATASTLTRCASACLLGLRTQSVRQRQVNPHRGAYLCLQSELGSFSLESYLNADLLAASAYANVSLRSYVPIRNATEVQEVVGGGRPRAGRRRALRPDARTSGGKARLNEDEHRPRLRPV